MFASQYDFGEIESHYDGNNVSVTLKRMPRPIAASVSHVMLGAMTAVAEHAGRMDIAARVESVERDGQDRGFEALRIDASVRWR